MWMEIVVCLVQIMEIYFIADCLNDRISGQVRLIEDSPKVQDYVAHLYTRLVK